MPGLVNNVASNAASNSINQFGRKKTGKGSVSPGKRFNLFISNEDMNGIITIIKLPEDS